MNPPRQPHLESDTLLVMRETSFDTGCHESGRILRISGPVGHGSAGEHRAGQSMGSKLLTVITTVGLGILGLVIWVWRAAGA